MATDYQSRTPQQQKSSKSQSLGATPPSPAAAPAAASRAASRAPRTGPRTAPASAASRCPAPRARRSVPRRAACTSGGTAGVACADEQLVGVTHPFHPLFGRRLACVGRRYNRYGERVLLQDVEGGVWSVPPQWTDLANEDPEIVMGGGQALLRSVDVLALVELVARLSGRAARSGDGICNVDYAAIVKPNTPQKAVRLVRHDRNA